MYYLNAIYHFGTKGQKWHRRRFQYEDGSLTPAGYERYIKRSSKKQYKTYKLSERKKKAAIKKYNGITQRLKNANGNQKKINKIMKKAEKYTYPTIETQFQKSYKNAQLSQEYQQQVNNLISSAISSGLTVKKIKLKG